MNPLPTPVAQADDTFHRDLFPDLRPSNSKDTHGDGIDDNFRKIRQAQLGSESEGKVFHSLRHTFKGVARRHMDTEWHDRLTGHASKSVGQTYGDYDLRTLKQKIDLIAFGIETPA